MHCSGVIFSFLKSWVLEREISKTECVRKSKKAKLRKKRRSTVKDEICTSTQSKFILSTAW